MTQIPIVHLDSFSRSGETLVLRALAAHPRLEVVHQIREPDVAEDIRLFRALMKREEPWIDSSDPLVAHRRLGPSSVLVLKNAVWRHPHPRAGLILIRNPFSVMKSAKVIGPEAPGSLAAHQSQCERWGRGIDPNLLPYVLHSNNLDAFCALYVRKMIGAFMTGMPIVHYEQFVDDSELVLRQLLEAIQVEWDPCVLAAHDKYDEGVLGHGKIKLWMPIHRKSLNGYRKLQPQVFDRIYALTAPVLELFGYDVEDRTVRISEGFDCRRMAGSARVVRANNFLQKTVLAVT